ncbi:MAG: sulfatase-like hydrolase/transferase [Planctomycetaceae bacterium]|nr:sulfatase-like hydrolase/transferase [Planctomycetaceae bacterium]
MPRNGRASGSASLSGSRDTMLVASLLAAVCLLVTSTAKAAESRPNILLIYTDDHSHRTVSCYPEAFDWVETSNIDRLAARGVRFAHAFIGTWCMPSRATILTGRHQPGVHSMRMAGEYPGSTYDPNLCPFWPKVFRSEGYTTAHVGKWHTGTDTGAGRDWDWQAVWNRPKYQQNSGHYFYNQIMEFSGLDQKTETKLVRGYSTDNYTNLAEDFIRGDHRQEGRPWFLWVCYGAVHGPFTPAVRHREAYPDIKVPTPKDIFAPRPGKPKWMQKIGRWEPGPNGEPQMIGPFEGQTVEHTGSIHGNTLAGWVRQYHQGVLGLDQAVGRLVGALQETGQLENTLVVFTSDQGFAWGQHGFATKLAPYDANIRSPLIISQPGTLPEGKVVEHPVAGVDLAPTFFATAGIKQPWKMHGHDLTPLLHKPDAEWPHPAMTVFTARSYGTDTDRLPDDPEERQIAGVPWYVMLRQGQHKYIRTLADDEIEELYDISNDPEELTNLALETGHRERLLELRKATLGEMQRIDWKMVDNLPPLSEQTK